MSTPTPKRPSPPASASAPSTCAWRTSTARWPWYTTALGLQVVRREGHEAALGTADGEDVVVLHEDPDARPAGRHSGLYHYALLYPSREELARAAVRLSVTGTPVDGASDHETHEAIYLPDADGNGIELAADRPRDAWPPSLGYAGGPQPLDVEDLLSTVAGEEPATEAAQGLRVGHVHLHVGDLERGLRFYRDLLGFDVMALLPSAAASSPPAATTTTSASTPGRARARRPSPPSVVGLEHWTLVLPGTADVAALRARVEAAGVPVEDRRGRRLPRPRPVVDPPARHGRRGGRVSPGPQGPMVPREPRAADPIGPGVHIGHVHLRTADTERVRAFYVDLLGFDVIVEARTCQARARPATCSSSPRAATTTTSGSTPGNRPRSDARRGRGPAPRRAELADAGVLRGRRAARWSTRACPSGRPATTAPTSRCTSPIPTATTSSSPGTDRRRSGRSTTTGTSRPSSATSTSTRCWPRPPSDAAVAAGGAPAVAAAGAAGVAAARAQPRRRAASSACCSDER